MTDKALQRLGSKIRSARNLKGLTQEEVAKKVGISRTYYSQIEKGERNPATTVTIDIVEVLQANIKDILN